MHLDCSVDRLRYVQLERIFRKSESFKLESPKSESFRSSWKKTERRPVFFWNWKVSLQLESSPEVGELKWTWKVFNAVEKFKLKKKTETIRSFGFLIIPTFQLEIFRFLVLSNCPFQLHVSRSFLRSSVDDRFWIVHVHHTIDLTHYGSCFTIDRTVILTLVFWACFRLIECLIHVFYCNVWQYRTQISQTTFIIFI